MNIEQQKEKIESLCDTLKTSMLNNLEQFPESWQDLEFRQYMNDKAQQFNPVRMTRTRMRVYKDYVEIHKL
ncbi:hypothetical protein G9F71_008485 [Clostridium sp. FP2]|uniref:hypothetical protein n=1 Tax=Clostridium sp. FP2 TaxID=2724481 RepID=UPI0013E98DC1|nr:hypothetical protein [Clostridium sp. FP2]MBZ9622889.1 hypothetical protein [Clostridium sp. FP2]